MVDSGQQHRSDVGGLRRHVAPHPWEVEVPSWTGHQALPSGISRGLLAAIVIHLFHPHASTETNRLTNGSGAPVCTRGAPRTPRHGLRARRSAFHICSEWWGGSVEPGGRMPQPRQSSTVSRGQPRSTMVQPQSAAVSCGQPRSAAILYAHMFI